MPREKEVALQFSGMAILTPEKLNKISHEYYKAFSLAENAPTPFDAAIYKTAANMLEETLSLLYETPGTQDVVMVVKKSRKLGRKVLLVGTLGVLGMYAYNQYKENEDKMKELQKRFEEKVSEVAERRRPDVGDVVPEARQEQHP